MNTNMSHETSNNSAARATRPTAAAEPRVLVPVVDVLESAEQITVLADLPGVRAEDVKLHLEKELLTLVAEYNGTLFDGPVHYKRTFQVPSHIDADGIEAKSDNGVLTLRFPRHASAQPRSVPVTSRG